MAANTEAARNEFVRNAIEAVIKIGAILIVLLWCFEIVRPFVGIMACLSAPLFSRSAMTCPLPGERAGRNRRGRIGRYTSNGSRRLSKPRAGLGRSATQIINPAAQQRLH